MDSGSDGRGLRAATLRSAVKSAGALIATTLVSTLVVGCAVVLGFDGPILLAGPEAAAPEGGATSDAGIVAVGKWSSLPLPPRTFGGRDGHTAVWTGTSMILWGGETALGSANDGAAFDPTTGTWSTLPPAPIGPRSNHAAIWTGREMIVWGGADFFRERFFVDGASYDPVTATWTVLPAPPPSFRARFSAAAVWSTTTGELIVWSGSTATLLESAEDGAAYKPETKSWRLIRRAPVEGRSSTAAVWSGRRLIFLGGTVCASNVALYCSDGASYDPVDDRWTVLPPPPRGMLNGPTEHIAVTVAAPGGEAAVFWGGLQNGIYPSVYSAKGAVFDEATESWTELATPSLDDFARAPRGLPSTFATGSRFFVWGGVDSVSVLDDGALYDVSTGAWSQVAKGNLTGRQNATVVWTGSSAIFWGGSGAAVGVYLDDGAIFTP